MPAGLATLPLALRANAAWTLAWRGRHDANWGRMLNSRSLLARYLADPHPRVRRLAEEFLAPAPSGHHPDSCAWRTAPDQGSAA